MKMVYKFCDGAGVCFPKGFLAGALHCGLKKSGKADICVLYSEKPCIAVAAFTENKFCAAPVSYCKEILRKSKPVSAVVVNSGNANACTGNRGIENARKMAEIAARCLNIETDSVLVASTGRIGVQLPMDKIKSGIEKAVALLSDKNGHTAAEAIMTTDLVRKECGISFKCKDGTVVRIGAMAKGSGMISPRMSSYPHATMLGFITTDAVVEYGFLKRTFSKCIARTFNKICVDNDMSTNDTVILLANGFAGNKRIDKNSPDAKIFAKSLLAIMETMAKAIVKDGEGATKFISINVFNARTESDAERCARAIANSMLCKTAWFGGDPNWGRVVAAAGYSNASFNPDKISVYYNKVPVIKNGKPTNTPEEKLAAEIAKKEFSINIDLKAGNKNCTIYTCDLSYDYVKINADYRT